SPLTQTPVNPVEEDEFDPPTMVAAKSAFHGMATIPEGEEEYDPPTMVAKTGAFQAAATIYQEDDDFEPPTMVAKTGAFQAANTFYDEDDNDEYEPPTIVNANSPFNMPPPILDQDEYEPPTMVAGASPFQHTAPIDPGVTSSTMVQGANGPEQNTVIRKAFAQTGKMAPMDYGGYQEGEPDLLNGNTGDEETLAALPGSTGPAMNMDSHYNAPGLTGDVTEVRATALQGSGVGGETVAGVSDYGASVPDDYEDYNPGNEEGADNKIGVESVSFRSASDFFMDSKTKDKKAAENAEATGGTKVVGSVLDKIPVPPAVLALFGVILLLGVTVFGYLSWSANSQISGLKADLAAARGNEVALSEFKMKCVQTIGSASLLLDVNEVFALKKAAENEIVALTVAAENKKRKKDGKKPLKDPKKTPAQLAQEKADRDRRNKELAKQQQIRRVRDEAYKAEYLAAQKLLKAKQNRTATTKLVRLAKRIQNEWPNHELASKISIPVTVSSYPSNARVYINKNRRPEGRTPLTFLMPVFTKGIVKIQEDSFDSVTEKIVANTYNAIDVELTRTIIDTMQIGKGRVPVSASSKRSISTKPAIELTPVLDSDREKNRIFVVSREGLLRAFKLNGKQSKNEIQQVWQLAPIVSRFGDAVANPAVTKRALFCSGAGVTEKLPSQNNQQVYFTVCAIDPDDGSKLWRYDTKSPCTSEPVLCDIKLKSQSYKAVIVGTLDGRVIALDQDTGEPIQNELRKNLVYQTGGAIVGKPFVRDNLCYALSKDNRLHVIDWTTAKPSLKFYVDLGDDPAVGPVLHDKWLFFANASGRLQAHELLADGTLKSAWSFEAGDAIREKLVFAEDRIYFSTGRRLICLLQKTGTLAPNWAPQTQSPVTAPVWGTEGAIYVCGGDGILRAIDSQSSQLLWTFALREGNKALKVSAAPFLLESNKVVVITEGGSVFSFKR
ncbi:MAG: PQQ-binding-like beta-propeller repeat protein, partial [Planctomycetota bacterium]|nr:PQQ-binding-like beta-propeller repeat protein [Planctomycetota bacterium]